MSRVTLTKAQKLYAAACGACRQWAMSTPAENLRFAENDRLAKSYGIKSTDVSKIISAACRERGL